MKELLAKDEIIFGPDETTQPQRKVYLSEHKALSSVIRDGSRGKKELENLGLDFTYSHPSVLYVTLLDAGLGSRARDSLVLDFFAGSGTNGHAVINLNREDGGKRKFTPEWKDGKPKRVATKEEARRGPRIVKYIRLESYEDALNNISFDDATGQQAMKFEDYLLQYMLKWESRMSETLLNIERLAKPFDYKLHIYGDGQTGEKLVDIPETFAHLLGLHVQTRRVYDDSGRRYLIYRGTIGLRNIAVIWRDTDGWKQVDFERDNKFVNRQKLAEGADEIFVNGDSLIPNARALEPIFKSRMFAPVEA
jgi:adenine-specific DNA-methyltransferase